MANGIADEQAAGLAPDFRKSLASFAHRGGVDNGQQFFNVVLDERIEEGLRAVLEVAHECVFGEGGVLILEGSHAAFALFLKGPDVGRKQAVQRKFVAFPLGERGALVQLRVEQQIIAGEMRVCDGGTGVFDWHGFLLLSG